MKSCFVRVALDQPLSTLFDYRYTTSESLPTLGMLVNVPFGNCRKVGLICEVTTYSNVPPEQLRDVAATCTICPPLSAEWLAFANFAADYYQRGVGEVALPALPSALRNASRWKRFYVREILYLLLPTGSAALPDKLPKRAIALRRLASVLLAKESFSLTDAQEVHPKATAILEKWREAGWVDRKVIHPFSTIPADLKQNHLKIEYASKLPALTTEQSAAVDAISHADGFVPFLLHSITGNGKTEIYLRVLANLFERQMDAQALVLVPEIHLVAQFEAEFRMRFNTFTNSAIVALHSNLTENMRAHNWLAAHTSTARIVLGTRLAVLASLPQLAIIIVDEEQDPAYKQQEGLYYSARDLAVWRAKQLDIPAVLGSATPSFESWWRAEQGRYVRLTLSNHAIATTTKLPTIKLIDLTVEQQRGHAMVEGLSRPLVVAMKTRLERGEQSLVFLNRRGYATTLSCTACGWVAGCPRCSVYIVFHKLEHALRCHHCGWESRVPYTCPDCGNVAVTPIGYGTQRIEEALTTAVPGARVMRIDADSTRRKNSATALSSDVHAGEVDILVGTQMIMKKEYDFQRISLVGVLNADTALFSHKFRASEQLFAQLIQVSKQASRAGLPGEVLIQTHYPYHTLYHTLIRYDYVGFATSTLSERRHAHLPPFIYQALLRAEARTLEAALRFLQNATTALHDITAAEHVVLYDAIPMTIAKVMHVYRAQLLVESASRTALQLTLRAWQPALRVLKGVLRWNIQVDPFDI